MKILNIMIAALISVIFSFGCMVTVKQNPPNKWVDWVYSKNKIALWINCISKKTKFLNCRVDCFRFWESVFFVILFLVVSLITIIDFSLDLYITNYLGNVCLISIYLVILFLPVLYETFLVIWWMILDKDNPKDIRMRNYLRIMKNNKKNGKRDWCLKICFL